jgi:hypothetical protein
MSNSNTPKPNEPVTPTPSQPTTEPPKPPAKPKIQMDIDEVDVSETLERKISA